MHESEKREDKKRRKPEADEGGKTSPAPKRAVDADRLYGPFDATQEDYYFATHPYGFQF